MSQFTEFNNLINIDDDDWILTDDLIWYLLYEDGPVVKFDKGSKGDYSAPFGLEKLSKLNKKQLAIIGISHDNLLKRGAHRIMASGILYQMHRSLGDSFIFSLLAFLGSWFVTSRGKK